MASNRGRTGKKWQTARTIILAEHTHCGICGGKVDRQQPAYLVGKDGRRRRNPLAPTVDHIKPLAEQGIDAQEDLRRNGLTNLQLAHFKCNNQKGSNHGRQREPRQQRNSRQW